MQFSAHIFITISHQHNTTSNMKEHLIFVLKYITIGLALGFLYVLFVGQTPSQNNHQNNNQLVFSYAPAIDKITPSVVSIFTQSNELVPNVNPGISPAQPFVTKNFLGSGVIVSANGHIITNKHVIKDATHIVVYLWNNEAYEASIVGKDTLTDLAAIKINAENLTPAEFTDSELLNTGDVVLAIGNPFGLNQSASLGIVSATGRRGLTDSQLENFIQTDAAINQGNSGGALINPMGQVVGINTASYNQFGAEGINFAIPSNNTLQIINSIIEFGEVLRGWLGIYFLQPQGHMIYGVPKPKEGIVVSKVAAGSSAAKQNIKTYDVITHMNDKPVNTFNEYRQLLLSHTVGDVVKLRGYNKAGDFAKSLVVELPPSLN